MVLIRPAHTPDPSCFLWAGCPWKLTWLCRSHVALVLLQSVKRPSSSSTNLMQWCLWYSTTHVFANIWSFIILLPLSVSFIQPPSTSHSHLYTKRKDRMLPALSQTWRNHLRPASPRVCLLSDKVFYLDWSCQGVGGHPWSSLSFIRPTVTRLSVTTNINASASAPRAFYPSFLYGIGCLSIHDNSRATRL